jgi:peptidylprolyl isomerase
MMPEVTNKVFLDVKIEEGKEGRILLGLFGKIAPKTVENFLRLCKCDMGKAKLTPEADLCYKGTVFHRVIPNFMIQSGDFSNHDGTGGESIYGGWFDDETFEVKHNRRFMLSMANSGRPNTNGSQFFINTVKTQWLDGHHVCFGRVLGGEDMITAIEEEGTYGGKPRSKITIVDSGELPVTPEEAEPIPVSVHAALVT